MGSNGSRPATKTELDAAVECLDQKIDSAVERLDQKIDSSVQRLAKVIVETQAEVREMKSVMSTKDDINRILGAIAAFAKKVERCDRAAVLHGHALVEVHVTLKSHEKRLKSLESAA